MAITETLKKIVGKVLSIGTPPEKEVLYKEVIKRKAPEKSAEAMVIDDIKNSIKKIWTPEDEIEFSRGTTPPPVKKAVKKKTPAKRSATKKTTATKKTATKTNTEKKPVAKKSTSTKKTAATKTTATTTKTTTKTSTEKKPVAKKATATKKPATKTAAKSADSKKMTSTKKTTPKTDAQTETTKKKTTTKKTATTKATASKTTTKKAPAKKETGSKKDTTPKGSKRDAKIALYIKDIKKHYGEVDEAFVAIVVKNLGPAIYRKDAELVSCSDPKELDTVRRNFLIKKLGIDASKGVLDAAIQDVCTELKGVRTKYRATFYYALAKKFKKESVLS